MNFETYCDEALPDLLTSQRPWARHLMIGSLWLPTELREEVKSAITMLRARHAVHPAGQGKVASMRCAEKTREKIRALICYAGSAPEASTGSKPIGSELMDRIARSAPGCQGIFDVRVARPPRTSRHIIRASRTGAPQPADKQRGFRGGCLRRVHIGRPVADPLGAWR